MLSTLFTSLLALAASASALTPANTANPPEGNPIGHPGLGELIPAGSSYTVTWTPTTPTTGKVSLVLLRGPSTNVVPILTIADSVPNTGSFVWAVPKTLEPDTTHYGIELIVEGTGQYQYSPQCGVSNPGFSGTGTGDSGAKSAGSGATASGSAATTTTATASLTYASGTAAGTGTGNFSVPVLSPTKAMSKPSSLLTETSTETAAVTEAAGTTAVPATPSPTQPQPSASSSAAAAVPNREVSIAGLAVAGLVGVLVL